MNLSSVLTSRTNYKGTSMGCQRIRLISIYSQFSHLKDWTLNAPEVYATKCSCCSFSYRPMNFCPFSTNKLLYQVDFFLPSSLRDRIAAFSRKQISSQTVEVWERAQLVFQQLQLQQLRVFGNKSAWMKYP